MNGCLKQELVQCRSGEGRMSEYGVSGDSVPVIHLSSSSSSSSSSDSDSDSDSGSGSGFDPGDNLDAVSRKRARVSTVRELKELGVVVPARFLQALPPAPPKADRAITPLETGTSILPSVPRVSKQFWKAGDYEERPCGEWRSSSVGMDHVRVHPRFLHSNATSHKWALGAFAELLDNSLDEVCHGATYVNVDMLVNKKDGSSMLVIEDNGGGMDPEKIRQCMSLGYSAKSKVTNTIGQYGNGFKTSTMRLGADVIVFSRCCGKDGKSPTQSIGLLSYTFLRGTGKEDIVVPMLDYERGGQEWKKIIRSTYGDWDKNIETIVQWSPFVSEADLFSQFNSVRSHGTRIIIYNLWEDEQGLLELDFDTDPHDIQIRGVNRDEKHIQMAKEYPNSKHFLTYRHSLRSYASILYLRLPPGFRIILRSKDVEHHNIVNDMMLSQEATYRPQPVGDGVSKNLNMVAVVTIGFVKDAEHHIDVQGFNVYHKNRLIKPFWRLWNAAGSDGRGVIGVLEANFVEPAHDKQGFERTTVLARLEARLLQMQKNYWNSNCHKIGYAPRRSKKLSCEAADRETSPDYMTPTSQSKKSFASKSKTPCSVLPKYSPRLNQMHGGKEAERFSGYGNAKFSSSGKSKTKTKSGEKGISSKSSPAYSEHFSDEDMHIGLHEKQANGGENNTTHALKSFAKNGLNITRPSSCVGDIASQKSCALGETICQPSQSTSKGGDVYCSMHSLSDSNLHIIEQLKEENQELRKRLEKREGELLGELLRDLQSERDRYKSLETQLQVANKKIEELNKEQESLIDIFAEERDRRENEEKMLKKKLQDANDVIKGLRDSKPECWKH